MRTSVRSKMGVLALAAIALVVLGSACGTGGGVSPQAAAVQEDGFWSALRVEGDDVEGFPTLAAMARGADAVVVGRFSSFGVSRTLQGDAAEDVVVYAKATLEIEKTLVGGAPAASVPLEFLLPAGPGEADAAAARLNQELPGGRMVVFLRGKRAPGEAGLYRVVNSRGLFAATARGPVDTPLAEDVPAADGLFTAELAAVRSIDDLATMLGKA